MKVRLPDDILMAKMRDPSVSLLGGMDFDPFWDAFEPDMTPMSKITAKLWMAWVKKWAAKWGKGPLNN